MKVTAAINEILCSEPGPKSPGSHRSLNERLPPTAFASGKPQSGSHRSLHKYDFSLRVKILVGRFFARAKHRETLPPAAFASGKPQSGSHRSLHERLPPAAFASGKPQSGYSLFELIIVVVVIGLLAAAGITYYLELQEEALHAQLKTQARNFAGAIQVVRSGLMLQQHPEKIPTEPGNKLGVDMDGTLIYVNELGWPANSSPELDSSSDTQTAAECYQLWYDMMNNPLPATVQGSDNYGGSQANYHISVKETSCRFELVLQSELSYYFDYNLKTGKILVNLPRAD